MISKKLWCGLQKATYLWQVVNAGIAQTLKILTGHNYQKWLDEGDNVDIWLEHQKGLTAMERRLLITQWVRNAWQEFCGSKYYYLTKRCWEKTGCLITADGSKGAKITPKAWQIIKSNRHYRIYQNVKPDLCQTLQIQLKMMKRNKRREH